LCLARRWYSGFNILLMGRFILGLIYSFVAFIILDSCTAGKHASYSYSGSKSHSSRPKPKYLDNIALGSKGGNSISMDVGSSKKLEAKETTDEDPAPSNIELLNNKEGAQQSVEIVAEDTVSTVQNKEIKPAAPKPVAGSKRHRHHKKKHKSEIDIDKEPLVDVVARDSAIVNAPARPVLPTAKDTLSWQTKYAKLLSCVPQAISNFPLYKFIDDWYGVDYHMGGDNKNGIDCSAFVQRLYLEVFGFSMVRTALEQYKNCTMEYDVNKLKEGDLVFFHIHSKHITHVGIYLMNNFFVHASASQGVVISSLKDDYWSKYFAGAGEILEDYAPMH